MFRKARSLLVLSILTMALGVTAPAQAAVPKCQGKKATIVGTAKADPLQGTRRADVIVGKGGNDLINGAGGNDIICAGDGADTVSGGGGGDKINGGGGADLLKGDAGNDRLNGETGTDTCRGAGGTNVYVSCEKPTFTLAVQLVNNEAFGGVTSTPAGIDCGSDCTQAYPIGKKVTLTANPAVGSTFNGWEGACSGTGTCTVTMTAARSVDAYFVPNTYPLTVTKDGSGSGWVSSSPAGIECGDLCISEFIHGSAVTLTVTPDEGSMFAGWSGAGCSGTGTCTVTMTEAATVAATFTVTQHQLTVTRSGAGTGTVTSSPAGINCGVDCTEVYNYGTVVILNATPSSGSTFTGWSGGGCSGTGQCQVTMTSAHTVTATFALL